MTAAPEARASSKAAAGRIDRLVLAQAHCSGLDVLAAALLVVAANRLARVPSAWGGWRVPLVAAAMASLVVAVGPWLTARFTVRMQRWLMWGAITSGSVGVVGAAWEIDVLALLALQLLLASAILAELGTQRRGVWWFWIVAGVLVVAFAAYHGLVDVRPRPE